MGLTTYRGLVRTYSDGLRRGTNDADLDAKTRRLAAVILATASNDGAADRPYPIAQDVRDAIIARTADRLWNGNARAIVDAIGPTAGDAYGTALERAFAILRNI